MNNNNLPPDNINCRCSWLPVKNIITPGTITSIGWLLDKIAQLKLYQFLKRRVLVKKLIYMRSVYLQDSINNAHRDRLIFETEGLKVLMNREDRVLKVNDVIISFEFLKIISDNTLVNSTSFIFRKDKDTGALKIVPNYTIVSNN